MIIRKGNAALEFYIPILIVILSSRFITNLLTILNAVRTHRFSFLKYEVVRQDQGFGQDAGTSDPVSFLKFLTLPDAGSKMRPQKLKCRVVFLINILFENLYIGFKKLFFNQCEAVVLTFCNAV